MRGGLGQLAGRVPKGSGRFNGFVTFDFPLNQAYEVTAKLVFTFGTHLQLLTHLRKGLSKTSTHAHIHSQIAQKGMDSIVAQPELAKVELGICIYVRVDHVVKAASI